MITPDEFQDTLNECDRILISIKIISEYSISLLGNVDWHKITEVDNKEFISTLAPCSEDHLKSLVNNAKRLSSYSDKFSNKINQLNKLITSENK